MRPPPINRRRLLAGAAAALLASVGLRASEAEDDPAGIEVRYGGRLGLASVDTGDGRRIDHRAGERFPMCSTFKLILVAAVLARIDGGRESLTRPVRFSARDMLDYAPVTRRYLNQGAMTISALCEAAIAWSDNTAANLLLPLIGGPPGWTAWSRSIGDHQSRLDRIEPYLNTALPGDPRDTTTPAAMLQNLHSILLGNVLSVDSRRHLIDWLRGNTTGSERLRAGLPATWSSGDKTGTGDNGATNDIAILWPPKRKPILVCAYFVDSRAPARDRNEALAQVGRFIVSRTASA